MSTSDRTYVQAIERAIAHYNAVSTDRDDDAAYIADHLAEAAGRNAVTAGMWWQYTHGDELVPAEQVAARADGWVRFATTQALAEAWITGQGMDDDEAAEAAAYYVSNPAALLDDLGKADRDYFELDGYVVVDFEVGL